MRRLLPALALLASPAFAEPKPYTLDPHHLFVVWKADHFGFSHPMGRFTKGSGDFLFDEKDPTRSSLDVTIDAASLATGDADFDHHLKSKDFFDVETYPTATFKSTKVTLTGKRAARVDGDLTLHGVTRPVSLAVTLNKIGYGPITQLPTAGFSAHATIRRSAFGMKSYLPGVGDDVALYIEAEASPADAAHR